MRTQRKKKKYYAVREGKKIGIFTDWKDVKCQVDGHSHCDYKAFEKKSDAIAWLNEGNGSIYNGEVITKKVSKEEVEKLVKNAYKHHHKPKTPFDRFLGK